MARGKGMVGARLMARAGDRLRGTAEGRVGATGRVGAEAKLEARARVWVRIWAMLRVRARPRGVPLPSPTRVLALR